MYIDEDMSNLNVKKMNQNLAYKDTFESLEQFKDNPLVKQFSLKSVGEATALMSYFEKRLKTVDAKNPKAIIYENAINTLELIMLQMANFTADLMFTGITEENVLSSSKPEQEEVHEKTPAKKAVVEPKAKMDVVHNKFKAEDESFEKIPGEPMSPVSIKESLKEAFGLKVDNDILIKWMNGILDNDLMVDSKLKNYLNKDRTRIPEWMASLQNGGMPTVKPTDKVEKEEKKEEVTLQLKLSETPVKAKALKELVKVYITAGATVEEVTDFIIRMKDANKIDDMKMLSKLKHNQQISNWYINLKKGLEQQQKLSDEKKVTETPSEKGKELIKEITTDTEEQNKSEEFAKVIDEAEAKLNANDKAGAIALIKYHLKEYGQNNVYYKDKDINRLINWITNPMYQTRDPYDVLENKPLLINDVIKEIERQLLTPNPKKDEILRKIEQSLKNTPITKYNSETDSQELVIFKDEKEIKDFLHTHFDFLFKVKEEVKDEPKKPAKNDQIRAFEEKLKKAEPTNRNEVFSFVKEWKSLLENGETVINIKDAFNSLYEKVKDLNPKIANFLKSSKTEEKAEVKEETVTEKSSKVVPFSEKKPDIFKKAKKVTTLKSLTSFLTTNLLLGKEDLFDLSSELISSGKITDAVTIFEEGQDPVIWDANFTKDWFRLSILPLFDSPKLLFSKNEDEFKNNIKLFLSKNQKNGFDDNLDILSTLVRADLESNSKYIRKLSKQEDLDVVIRSMMDKVVKEKQTVSST